MENRKTETKGLLISKMHIIQRTSLPKMASLYADGQKIKKIRHGTIKPSLIFLDPSEPLVHTKNFYDFGPGANFLSEETGYAPRTAIVDLIQFFCNY